MTLHERWTTALETLRGQGRYRTFAVPHGIDLTSNDYLGYGNGRLMPAASMATALPHTGIASRSLRGNHPIWETVEHQLARWHQTEAILMMTSGYTANEGLISTIVEPGDWVASDDLIHACIIDGLRLARCRRFSFRHNDLGHLEAGLRAEVDRGDPDRQRFILTESLFSMDGDFSPLLAIVELAEKYGAHVIVDEAHSTGCFNSNGSGYVDQLGVRSRILASVHTGGKALGVPGAYIAGSQLLKEYLINRCRHLIFTTALPPIAGEWWLQMLERVSSDGAGRAQLLGNAERFHQRLRSRGLNPLGSSYVVPVVLGEDVRAVAVARDLQAAGYDIRAIRPPSVPPGTSRLRISVHADHDPTMLDQLVDFLAERVMHHG